MKPALRPPTIPPRLRPGAALALIAVLAAAACSTAPPPQSAVIAQSGNIKMTTVELRLRVYGHGEEFAGGIEDAADEILASTRDVGISRNALKWKLNGINAVQVAAFSLDPLAGLYDLWVLAVQMREFFETGNGREAFGPHQSLALETARRIEQRVNQLAASISISGDVSDVRRRVEATAAAHPINSLQFVRESATTEFAGLLGKDQASGLAVLGDLSVQVGDLTERLKYYAAGLPAQFRWQSELLLLDILDEQAIDEFLGDVESIDNSAQRLADFADTVPAIVDQQATAAVLAIGEEVAIALRDVDRQRIETLEWLTEERIIVMEDVVRERIAAMEDLTAITDSAMRRTTLLLDDAVDRAFYRALQLLGVVFVGGLLFVFLVRLIWKHPSAALGSRAGRDA